MPKLPMILCLAALLALAAPGAAQTTITLRDAAQIASGAPIRVEDVAQVTGPDADRLGSAVIVFAGAARSAAAVTGRIQVDVAEVRGALDKAGINWGKATLRGAACSIRFAGDTAPTPIAPAPAAPAPAAAPEVIDLRGPATVRTHIAARLADLFAVDPSDLRVRFRPEDGVLLATATAGRRVDVQPGASSANSRLPVQVYVYAGDRVIASGAVTVEVQVRRQVWTAAIAIERGQSIAPEVVTSSMQWLEPNAKSPAAGSKIIGSIAKGRINAGQVIIENDLEPPLAAKRGDLVWVHCLSGGVTVKGKARAMTDARDGELVQLRMDGTKKNFTGRMSGARTAVVDLSGGES